MRIPASIGKHLIHPALIVSPVGLWQPRVPEWEEHP